MDNMVNYIGNIPGQFLTLFKLFPTTISSLVTLPMEQLYLKESQYETIGLLHSIHLVKNWNWSPIIGPNGYCSRITMKEYVR